jgi:hypothetical protein
MATVVKQTMDIPHNVTRWWIKKDRETNGSFSRPVADLFLNTNNKFQITLTQLPNGKTRVTTINKWATQQDYNSFVAFLAPYVAERDAYHAANNIDFTETTTEE